MKLVHRCLIRMLDYGTPLAFRGSLRLDLVLPSQTRGLVIWPSLALTVDPTVEYLLASAALPQTDSIAAMDLVTPWSATLHNCPGLHNRPGLLVLSSLSRPADPHKAQIFELRYLLVRQWPPVALALLRSLVALALLLNPPP